MVACVVVGVWVVVVGACVVVGASLVVDGGVPVSDWVDDGGGVLTGACVFVASDGAGLWLAGAGVVLTLGVGVPGALPDV